LRGACEACRETGLHGAAQDAVDVARERRRVERLTGFVGEGEVAGRLFVGVDEEGGVFDVEPAAKGPDLDDEGALGLGEADAAAEGAREARVGDLDALVPEAAVAAQPEAERRERGCAQSASLRSAPSGDSSIAPRKS